MSQLPNKHARPSGSTLIIDGVRFFNIHDGDRNPTKSRPIKWWGVLIGCGIVFAPSIAAAAYTFFSDGGSALSALGSFALGVGWTVLIALVWGVSQP